MPFFALLCLLLIHRLVGPRLAAPHATQRRLRARDHSTSGATTSLTRHVRADAPITPRKGTIEMANQAPTTGHG